MKRKVPLPEEMAKTYDVPNVEKALYQWWEEEGYFKPVDDESKKTFVISMPPPNVTGILHLGHAITSSVEDALTRYHRMLGDATLWVPGADHAGIATQNVVERELAKNGISRQELGREKFVQEVWAWKDEYLDRITNQQRSMGVSCDWSRERFTLDDGLSRAVREAFVRLYEKKLIYRGQYLVNWCPRCGTAISDLEVEHEDETAHLWYVRYWTPDHTESMTVATTRPETIMGDTAVAVHPEDERYQHMIGKELVVPVVNRRIKVIADEAVEKEFGTGAVKVTPAHDPTDYEMGLRHGLEFINVMNDDSTMNENAGKFEGQDRFVCRKNLLDDLREAGDLVKIEDLTHSVGHCQRCHTIAEPRISTQWFVRMKPLAKPALEAVRNGSIKIIPERFTKIYFDWLENIRDWCISRQLWWGHRIPVWYCQNCGAEICSREDPTVCPKCGSTNLKQDEDVLDTWFSSGLWPFSTLGWPDQTPDLERFYPISVMETGYDIIFFWVARMVMLGLEMTGEIPFHTIYLHGLVRSEDGKKVSKSMEDAWRYDPLLIVQEYGVDPLRFTLLTSSTPGNDMKLSLSRVEANRNFANKIWQASRFVLGNLGDDPGKYTPSGDPLDPAKLDDAIDRWIVSRYHSLVAEVNRLLSVYQLGEAGRQIYDFLWGEFCDWYIEATKVRLYEGETPAAEQAKNVLIYVLDGTLRLLHPYMPYTTETIWHYLPHQGEALIVASWPQEGPPNANAEANMDALIELVRGIRNARSEYDVEPGRKIAAIIAGHEMTEFLTEQQNVLKSLARIADDRLMLSETLDQVPQKALTLVIGTIECYLPLADLVDLDRERERLGKEAAQLEAEIERSEGLLSNEKFVNKAPEAVVQRERDKIADYQERLGRLRERLGSLD